jgi:hypothetical protein
VFKFNVSPVQTGVLLDAVGVAGFGFTTTLAVAVADTQPLTVIVRL